MYINTEQKNSLREYISSKSNIYVLYENLVRKSIKTDKTFMKMCVVLDS